MTAFDFRCQYSKDTPYGHAYAEAQNPAPVASLGRAS
jgi:hypothetical protein